MTSEHGFKQKECRNLISAQLEEIITIIHIILQFSKGLYDLYVLAADAIKVTQRALPQ